MSRAFVFPGQGSQAVGMGTDLAAAFGSARDVFHEIDEALKQNLSKLMREGPESELVLTENAQPALMAVSMAVVRILEKDGGKPIGSLASHVAGHSLGEYSALAAAGSVKLADAARLLKLRGQSMQKAVPVGVGAMAALLGIELEPAQDACREAAQGEVVAVANDNGGGQVVVSGHKAAVERTIEVAKSKGCKRGMLLPVSAPFHCSLMQPAADAMKEALEKVSLATPVVPLIANVLASEITEPEEQWLTNEVGYGGQRIARRRPLKQKTLISMMLSARPSTSCPPWLLHGKCKCAHPLRQRRCRYVVTVFTCNRSS